MTESPDILKLIQAKAKREIEIQTARAAFPKMEIGTAFKKWKEDRGEKADLLFSGQGKQIDKEARALMARLSERPCTRPGCTGSQHLEGICSGCIEGQAGYKTKWTCRLCLHRDLSKEDLNQWIIKLSSG